MENHDLLQGHEWKFLARFGLDNPFWTLQADTIISTLFILGIIIVGSIYINQCLKNKNSMVRFIALQYVQTFRDLVLQTLKYIPQNHLAFVGSLFTFIFLCNTVQLFPGFEEPTKDLNTTLALGLIAFFYIQTYAIKVNGLKHYIAGFFDPFFLLFPLNVIGTLTLIVSLSFRLFGNIFGGYIITALYNKMISGSIILQTFAFLSGLNLAIMFAFGLFEGLIQAFVFSMLTLTYLSIEIMPEDIDDEKNEDDTKEKLN